jgi:hypothetical protein
MSRKRPDDEPFLDQKRQKGGNKVETHAYQLQQLGGDDINLSLPTPRTSVLELKHAVAREEGISAGRQVFFLIATSDGGGPVREDDAEPVLLADSDMVEAGQKVTVAVEGDVWARAGPSIVISEEGTVASLGDCEVGNEEAGEHANSVVGGELLESGQHYWEVEIVHGSRMHGKGVAGLVAGVCKPNMSLSTGVQDTDTSFFGITAYCGATWGNNNCRDPNEKHAGAFVTGDRFGLLLDLDQGSLIFFKNGKNCGIGFKAGSVIGPVVRLVTLGRSSHSARLHVGVPFPAAGARAPANGA